MKSSPWVISSCQLKTGNWRMGGKFWTFNMVQIFGVPLRISDRPVMVENKSRSILHVLSCALSLWTSCSQNRVSGKAGELTLSPSVSTFMVYLAHQDTCAGSSGRKLSSWVPEKKYLKMVFCYGIWEKVWSFCFDVTLLTSEAGQCRGMDVANPSVSNVFSFN